MEQEFLLNLQWKKLYQQQVHNFSSTRYSSDTSRQSSGPESREGQTLSWGRYDQSTGFSGQDVIDISKNSSAGVTGKLVEFSKLYICDRM